MIKDPVFFISQYYKNPDLVNLTEQTRVATSAVAEQSVAEQLTQCLACTWISRSSSSDEEQNNNRLTKLQSLANYGHAVFIYEFAIEFFLHDKSESGLVQALSYLGMGDVRYRQDVFCSTNLAWIEKATDLTAIYLDFLQTLCLRFLRKSFQETLTPIHQIAIAETTVALVRATSPRIDISPSWLTFHSPETNLSPGQFVPNQKMFRIRQLVLHRAAWSAEEKRISLVQSALNTSLSGVEREIERTPPSPPEAMDALLEHKRFLVAGLSQMRALHLDAQTQHSSSTLSLRREIEET